MTIEDEVLFQRFGIVGYDTDARGGVCDGASSSSSDDNPGPDGLSGFGGGPQGHDNA